MAKNVFQSNLEDCFVGYWVPWKLPDGKQIEVTALPVVDGKECCFARLTYNQALELAARESARLMTVSLVNDIVAHGYFVPAVILPTRDMTPPKLPGESEVRYQSRIREDMASLEWCKKADYKVCEKLANWDGELPVACQKDWIEGAPDGKAWNYGFFTSRTNRPIQSLGGAHDRGHVDYSQLTRLWKIV